MIILAWLISGILLIVTSLFLACYISKHVSTHNTLRTISQGFLDALKSCGFHINRKSNRLTHYKWIITQDEEPICDDCLERTQWPAMDISEWMKAGLPNSREPLRKCGGNCQCSLAPCKTNKSHHEH